MATPEPNTPPAGMFSTGDLSRFLGFSLSAPFIIDVLKVENTSKWKAGKYWDAAATQLIYRKLVEHIVGVAKGNHAPERIVVPRKPKEDKKADTPPADDDDIFNK